MTTLDLQMTLIPSQSTMWWSVPEETPLLPSHKTKPNNARGPVGELKQRVRKQQLLSYWLKKIRTTSPSSKKLLLSCKLIEDCFAMIYY